MLIRLEDIKGRVAWVNPVHVKAVTEDKKGRSHVCFTFTGLGAITANAVVVVDEPADTIAERLNQAMPDLLAGYVPDDHSSSADGGAGGAAGAMGMMG
jgi:hypothetical protein